MTRGAINTVEEVVESNKGKDWDQEKREWYEYNLQTDAQLASQLDDEAGGGAGGGGGGGGGGSGGSGRAPKDTRYYDSLGVRYDASTDAIKKARRRGRWRRTHRSLAC